MGGLNTRLPGSAAGRAGSVPGFTAGCPGQDPHGGVQEAAHAVSSSQSPGGTPEKTTSLSLKS